MFVSVSASVPLSVLNVVSMAREEKQRWSQGVVATKIERGG